LKWLSVHAGTVESSNNLAQASQSRPNESIRGCSLEPAQIVAQATCPCFWVRPHLAQARRSRLSERTRRPCSHFSISRLGKKNSPKRGKPLAWARPFCLSKKLGEKCICSVVSLFLYVGHMFGLIIHFKAWIEWLCMSKMNYGMWLMSLTWFWYDACMEWFMG